MTSSLKTPDEFFQWNEQMAAKYNPDAYHESSNLIIRWIEGSRVRRILSFLDVSSYHRILEVGVGAGNILAQVPAQDRSGLDLSPSLLALAKHRLPDASFYEGNAEAFPSELHNQTFDRIFCSEVLEHVQHPERVIDEMAAALRKDGVAVISVPNEKFINKLKSILLRMHIFSFLFSRVSMKMDDEWHLHVFDEILLQKTVKRAFVIERLEAIPFFWLPIRWVAKLRKIDV